MAQGLTHRVALPGDGDALAVLIDAAISQLQRGFLDPQQIAASRAVMGLDRQLIEDGSYFIIVDGEGSNCNAIVGCGGWSRRATLYGGDHSHALRDPALLDPASDAARIRAMYTHPDHARRGIGRMILSLCEDAAQAAGFSRVELMATLSGEPLYRACGYDPIERIEAMADGIAVPLIRMGKALAQH